ncbi:MAG: nuclear transport factor 2 family protein [bacterium]
MPKDRKQMIFDLLKGIETGDPAAVAVVNEEKYIQHNPQTHEGSEGLATLFKRLSRTSPRVNVVRVFSDGEFVFAHTEYDFASRNIGFEIFRFENDQAVEHWDNIQARKGPNQSGHSMVDGEVLICDHDKTEHNREIVTQFVHQVLIGCDVGKLSDVLDRASFTEHNPEMSDELDGLQRMLSGTPTVDGHNIRYKKCHRVLAEGNFVLSACEGLRDGKQCAFFDLYRLRNGRIVEHWDTTEDITPRGEWKNSNGKF